MVNKILSLAAACSTMIAAQTIVPGGNVSGTWNSSGSPYLIQGEITVPAGETLNIQPGVEVNFQGHYKLIVNGWLEAFGTETDSILFTAEDTVTGWSGIRFINAADGSHLAYCIVQYGLASGFSPDNYGGGIFCDNSRPNITYCTVTKNKAAACGGGIYCSNHANPNINNCTIAENSLWDVYTDGGGIYCGDSSNPVIDQCVISGNSVGFGGHGGGVCCSSSEPTIINNTINGNSASFGGGIYCAVCSPIINYCTISGNTATTSGGGIGHSDESYPPTGPSISYCVINGNSAEVGGSAIVFGMYSTPLINHCDITGNSGSNTIYLYHSWWPTFVNTIVEGNSGSGIYFYGAAVALVEYSDFHNNGGGNFTGNVPSGLGIIDTINANGDSCDVFYNIFQDPLFENPVNNNFQITWQNWPIPDSTRSPCIDAGDPSSPPDPDSTIADIGALYFNQYLGTIIPGGNVSGTWTQTGSPYLIQGDIIVPVGETLNIEPGVEVNFQGHYKIIVYGWLEAFGTEADSILFTAGDTTTGWFGIRFMNAPDSSHLSFCIVEYGRATGYMPYGNCGGGVYCAYSNPRIDNCSIRNNSAIAAGGGICCDYNSSPTITNCSITGNSAQGGGGIDVSMSTPSINFCTISHNSAGYGGGIISEFATSSPVINHCIISENTAIEGGGFDAAMASDPILRNCTISRNSASSLGGGIYYWSASLTLANTIVEGNFSNGGIYFHNDLGVSITHCDFSSNGGGNFIGSIPSGLGTINAVNANGDSCDVFHNIFEDPLFADPINGNFQITWQNFPVHDSTRSPCIDAGDPNSPLDPDSTIADIGAFYFDQPYVPSPLQVSLTPYNPPIFIPQGGGAFAFHIEFTNTGTDTAQFDAWINIEIPNGYQFTLEGPIYDLRLAPGRTIARDRAIFVPPNAPAGDYSCIAMIGTYPWNVIDSDAFTFIKEGTNTIWKGSKGWRINGESFK